MFPKGSEWILILVVVLLLFGARKLPELARSLGASAKEFRKGISEGSAEDKVDQNEQAATTSADEPAAPAPPTPPKSI
ncbi:MAG TPA: twin-arginine translocase TatA/TatE family subunit [Acidimicrobiia bacterium]|nr:twin-arginine translocase TatA/TatE family subunit [Acidimicrobiia bacterium]HKZ20491.1 twin-arginine translocase TatA/TatE family subunit [Acidimicrobiia bacterium]